MTIYRDQYGDNYLKLEKPAPKPFVAPQTVPTDPKKTTRVGCTVCGCCLLLTATALTALAVYQLKSGIECENDIKNGVLCEKSKDPNLKDYSPRGDIITGATLISFVAVCCLPAIAYAFSEVYKSFRTSERV